jgi:hypothetical protein
MGDLGGLMETMQDLKLNQNKNLIKNFEAGELNGLRNQTSI